MAEAVPGEANGREIDLHAHTTASDGSATPAELVELAVQRGLSALAVTDHDTLGGLPAATRAAAERGLELVPGVELGVEFRGRFHLLGYLFDPQNPALSNRLRHIQEFRANRNERMVQKMHDAGLPIILDDILAEAGGDLVGRPHMALAMVKKGLVSTVQEAFDRYLADGALVHLPKDKVTPEEGIRLIREAGGVPVMAHPTTIKLDADEMESELRRLKGIGLGGIECYYSQHTPEQEAFFLHLAKKLDLVATGGSDFHGASKPHVQLGIVSRGRGASYVLLEALKEARTS